MLFSDNHYLYANEAGTYTLSSQVLTETGKRHFYPHFGFAYKVLFGSVKVVIAKADLSEQVEVLNKVYNQPEFNDWQYFFKDLSQVAFLQDAWDSGTETDWLILIMFENRAGGVITVDNMGPCALEEIFFPGSVLHTKRVSSCFWMGVS